MTDKDGKLMLAILSKNQKCKIQRIGSNEYEETTFNTEYSDIRRVIIEEE